MHRSQGDDRMHTPGMLRSPGMLDHREMMGCTGFLGCRSQGDAMVDTDLTSRAEVSSPRRADMSLREAHSTMQSL